MAKKLFKRILSLICVLVLGCGFMTACDLSILNDLMGEDIVYNVTVTKNIDEAGTVTGAGSHFKGAKVTLSATTNDGYRFVGWKKANGQLETEQTSFEITVSRDVTYSANWIRRYVLTLEKNIAEAGTVIGGGIFDDGTTAPLIATANAGYQFDGWYDGTTKLSSASSYNYVVRADKTLQAQFSEVASGGDDENDAAADLQIHFLELGNKYTGDCTLIKTGDTEVLIDAGSRKGSAATIVPYIQQYCTDGVLEYVIATHAHQDHIAGFVGTTTSDGVFESFTCGTIIDFARTEVTTAIYSDYVELREAEVAAGATHYTALDCWNNVGGAQRSYTLGQGITMNILYQKYYEQDASDENDYSVCMLLSQGDNHYLFTGDLGEHGEESLVQENTLPQVKLFKAGHHGSYTANTDTLLSVIRPEIVCVCCCCGTDEYTDDVANQFPSQTFINNVAPYTDKIYVTSITDGNDGFTSCNGNIVVSSSGSDVTVNCSNNNTIFKETQWFIDNRTWPSNGVNSG